MEDYEKKLEDAGEQLRKLMGEASSEIKAKLFAILQEINKFVDESQKNGQQFEVTSLFAAAIIATPQLSDEMKLAAKTYIQADYEYVQALAETFSDAAFQSPEAEG